MYAGASRFPDAEQQNAVSTGMPAPVPPTEDQLLLPINLRSFDLQKRKNNRLFVCAVRTWFARTGCGRCEFGGDGGCNGLRFPVDLTGRV